MLRVRLFKKKYIYIYNVFVNTHITGDVIYKYRFYVQISEYLVSPRPTISCEEVPVHRLIAGVPKLPSFGSEARRQVVASCRLSQCYPWVFCH